MSRRASKSLPFPLLPPGALPFSAPLTTILLSNLKWRYL